MERSEEDKRIDEIKQVKKNLRSEKIAFGIIKSFAFLTIIILGLILFFILLKGFRYSNIERTKYVNKFEDNPDGFVIIVNKNQGIEKITWEDLNGIFEDFYIDWEKIDGSVYDILPVLPEFDFENSKYAYELIFNKDDDESIGALTEVLKTEEDVFEFVSDNKGSIGVIREKTFQELNSLYPGKVKRLSLQRYSLILKDEKLLEDNSFNTEFEAEKEKELLKDNRFRLIKTMEALEEGRTIIRFTSIKTGLNLNFKYLIEETRGAGKSGGISGIIINTFFILALTLLIAVPLGVGAALYLTQFARAKKLIAVIRFGIETLAGIPSIIFGLFGSVLFVNFLGLGFGLLSGALTLSLMILPTIIRTSEEAIISVPMSLSEASFGLGATKLETIRLVILPSAVPGIITGLVLGMGRAMGETAALLFTMGSDYKLVKNLFSSARSLSTHVYLLFAEGIDINKSFATAAALILFILIFNFFSKYLINKIRAKV